MDRRIKERLLERSLILKAMAHPLRLFIIEELAWGECCVNDLGQRSSSHAPTVSRHLSLLRSAGILTSRKVGLRVFYGLAKSDLSRALSSVEAVLEGKARRIRALCRTEERMIPHNRRIPHRTFRSR